MKQKNFNCTYLWSSPEVTLSLFVVTVAVPDPTNRLIQKTEKRK